MENYYDILGVDRNATTAEIKKAYRKLVRKYHPDVSKEADAVEKAAKVNVAYETLKDAGKRAEYDMLLDNPYAQQQAAGNGADFSDFFRQYANQQSQNGNAGYSQGEPFGQGDFRFEDIFSAFSGAQARRQSHSGTMRGEDQHAELTVNKSA